MSTSSSAISCGANRDLAARLTCNAPSGQHKPRLLSVVKITIGLDLCKIDHRAGFRRQMIFHASRAAPGVTPTA